MRSTRQETTELRELPFDRMNRINRILPQLWELLSVTALRVSEPPLAVAGFHPVKMQLLLSWQSCQSSHPVLRSPLSGRRSTVPQRSHRVNAGGPERWNQARE
jgi:hypothetical protein